MQYYIDCDIIIYQMQVININLQSIIIEKDINEDDLDRLIEDYGGIKLSKNNYTVDEFKDKEIRKIIKHNL